MYRNKNYTRGTNWSTRGFDKEPEMFMYIKDRFEPLIQMGQTGRSQGRNSSCYKSPPP